MCYIFFFKSPKYHPKISIPDSKLKLSFSALAPPPPPPKRKYAPPPHEKVRKYDPLKFTKNSYFITLINEYPQYAEK